MKIFLDDVRTPSNCIPYMYKRIGKNNLLYLERWEIVKNFDELKELIIKSVNDQLEITHISFDHDLADEHYDPSMNVSDEDYSALYDTFKEKTGYDCAKWLIEFYNELKLDLPIIFVHSMNPVGTENIINLFNEQDKD